MLWCQINPRETPLHHPHVKRQKLERKDKGKERVEINQYEREQIREEERIFGLC